MSTYTLRYKDNEIKVEIPEFDEFVDIEQILKIDYAYLIAEIITFSVIINRFGLMLADADNELSEKKLDLEIYESRTKKQIREEFDKRKEKSSIDKVNEELYTRPLWYAKRKAVNLAQKNRDYINSIYWSCKEKSNKLEKLSLTIKRDDELLLTDFEQPILNGITFKKD